MSEPKHKEPPETRTIPHVATGRDRDVLFALAAAWSASTGRPIALSRSKPRAAQPHGIEIIQKPRFGD